MKKWKRAAAFLLSFSLIGAQLLGTCYAADWSESLEAYVDEENDREPEEDPYSFPRILLASDSNSMLANNANLPDEYGIMPLAVGVDDAFLVICKIVFAACGVVASGSNLERLSNSFYYWLRDRCSEWSEAFQAAKVARTLTVGVSAAGIAHLLKAAKAFLGDIKGYGTASASYSVPKYISMSSVSDPVSAGYCAEGAFTYLTSFLTGSVETGIYFQEDIYMDAIPKAAYNDTFLYGLDDNNTPLYCHIAHVKQFYREFSKNNTPSYFGFKLSDNIHWPFGGYPLYNYYPDIPYFNSLGAATYYLTTGTIRDMSEVIFAPSSISIAPVIDAQLVSADDISISDDIVIPEIALLEQLLANVATKEDIKIALKDVLVLDYAGDIVLPTDVPIPSESASEGEDTSDPYLPWVPDITGRLDGILSGLDGFGNVLDGIANGLTGFGEAVQALPGSIAQAISDVVIGTPDSSLAVDSIIVDKFPFCVPYDLVSCVTVLKAESVPPVWKVPFVIDSLNFRYEIVLDLTQWTQVVAVIRGFLLLMFIVGLVLLTRTLIRG